jgi:hypothetical protein
MDEKIDWNGIRSELTKKQEKILETSILNPEMTNAKVAVKADASESYVAKVRRDYEDKVEVKQQAEAGDLVGMIIWLTVVAPMKLSLWAIKVSLAIMLAPLKLLTGGSD